MRYVVGTGYGRYRVTFGDKQVTEISCHGRGAVHMFPDTRTVIDMGGQDSKAIRVGADGEIVDFCMNDKCAAGTGRFLGAAAKALGLSLDELGPTALQRLEAGAHQHHCTVFAESEVLSWLGKGQLGRRHTVGCAQVDRHALVRAAAARGRSRTRSRSPAAWRATPAWSRRSEEALGKTLNVSDDSHYVGALGAALFARDAWRASEVAVPAEPAGAVSDSACCQTPALQGV